MCPSLGQVLIYDSGYFFREPRIYWWRIPDSNRGPADYDSYRNLATQTFKTRINVSSAAVAPI